MRRRPQGHSGAIESLAGARRSAGAGRPDGRAAVVALMVTLLLAPRATASSSLGERLAALAGFTLDTVDVVLADVAMVIEAPADAVLVSWEGDTAGAARGAGARPPRVGRVDGDRGRALDEHRRRRRRRALGADRVGPVWAWPRTEAVEVALAGGPPRRAEVQLLRSVQGLVTGVVDDPAGELARVVEGLANLPTGRSATWSASSYRRRRRWCKLAAPGVAPPILPPSAWGSPGWSYSTPTCENGPESAPLQRAIVHHTVTPNSVWPRRGAGDVAVDLLRPPGAGLVRHRLQLRGRRLRPYLAGAPRPGRRTRDRRPRQGMEHRQRRIAPAARSAPPGGAPAGGGADRCRGRCNGRPGGVEVPAGLHRARDRRAQGRGCHRLPGGPPVRRARQPPGRRRRSPRHRPALFCEWLLPHGAECHSQNGGGRGPGFDGRVGLRRRGRHRSACRRSSPGSSRRRRAPATAGCGSCRPR